MAGGTTDDNIPHSAEIPTPKNGSISIEEQNENARAQQQAQHTAVISLTVRNTNKILKEIGFRRARLRVRYVYVYVYVMLCYMCYMCLSFICFVVLH